jgi:acyl transferase domain-containing protein
MGEYAAACAAGVFSLGDALKLISTRGRLMHGLPKGGAMAAVGVDEDRIRRIIAGRAPGLSIAGVNGPSQVVITGPRDDVAAVVAELAAEEVPTHWVPVTHAFHSPLRDPIVPEIVRTASGIRLSPAQITFASTLTGSIVRSDEMTQPAYWGRQARETVQFSRALTALYEGGYRVFVEVGPTPALLGAARRAISAEGCSWIPSLKNGRSDWEQMLESVGALYVTGVPVDWTGFDGDYVRRKTAPLPTYPFERQRYWLETRAAQPGATRATDDAPWKEWLHDLVWQPVEGAAGAPADAAAIRAAAETAFERLAAEHELRRYDDGRQPLDRLCAAYVTKALADLGWHPQPGESFTTAALMERCGVSSRHTRLFERLLSMHAEDGVLRATADGWLVIAAPPVVDPDAARRAFVEAHPAFTNEVALLARCGARLADVLTERTTGVDVLFTSGDADALERVYQDTAAARAFNALVAETALRAVAHVKDRPIRILEIGAGTGGTTSALLPLLDAGRTQYVYTDVSAAFFARARRKFADYPFVEYKPLDISRDPAAQGFDAASFDLVIAANVLHATPDLRRTLKHATGLLNEDEGGAMVMLEGTRPQRFIDLTFGLTDDWWGFTDPDVRPSHVLVGGEDWRRLLAEFGLTDSMSLPRGADGRESDLSVILARRPAQDTADGRWLILADAGGYGERLAARLRSAGGTCTLVVQDAASAADDPDRVVVNAAAPDDVRRLIADSGPAGGYRAVVHLWALDENPGLDADSASLDRAAERACGSALYLAQALAAAGASSHTGRLVLVTRGAQDVVPSDDLSPMQATLAGLGRVIALEHPELACLRVDLDPTGSDADVDALVDRLCARPSGEDQLALRRGQWFGARLVPSAIRPLPSEPLTFRADATYLITGGAAGLGLLVAERMVARGARQLVLVGRRAPEPEAQAAIDALGRKGAEIKFECADVADRASVDRVVAAIDARRAPLRGVVHAAGALDDGALFNQSWDRFRSVLAAKLHGTCHLDAATRGHALDFFVLFSTSAALLGSPGQANHAAANAFMDAFARHRRKQGLPGASINWGAWAQVGAAARRGVVERVAARGVGGINPDAGLDAFEHTIRSGSAQVAVIPIRWDDFLAPWPSAADVPRFYEAYAKPAVAESASRASSTTPAAAAPPKALRALSPDDVHAAAASERLRLVVDFCGGVVADVVGMPSIRATQRISELGADSLMAVEIRNRIQRSLGVPLPLVALLDGTTVNELAGRLLADLEAQRGAAAPPPAPDAPISAAEASELLSQLDGLSEEEMDGLLNRFAARNET